MTTKTKFEVVKTDTSSLFSEISYDEKSYVLKVKFKTGAEYIYKDVPMSAWTSFKSAPSKGNYYASQIKGKYNPA